MPISNVALTNTFDEWRVTTNQLIVVSNDILGDGLTTYRSVTANVVTANTLFIAGLNVRSLLATAYNQANVAYNQANVAQSSAVLKTGNTMTGNLVMSGANIAFSSSSNNGLYWSGAFVHSPGTNRLSIGTTGDAINVDANRLVNVSNGLYVTGTVSTARANVLSQTLTDAATISWDASLGQVANVTLTDGVGASRTFGAPTNLRVGTYILYITQGGTGSKDINWNPVFKWTQGVKPILSTVAGRVDIISLISDGTNLYGVMIPDVR